MGKGFIFMHGCVVNGNMSTSECIKLVQVPFDILLNIYMYFCQICVILMTLMMLMVVLLMNSA